MASRSWNRVELIGNLTRDPELRFTPTGTAVATFGVATNRSYISEGERKEEVDFHRVVAWGKLAELCNQLLKKGSRVFISGRLQYREWETQDGQKKRDAEIVLEDMIQLTPKNGSESGEEALATEHFEESVNNEAVADKPKETPTSETKVDASLPSKPNETVADEDLPF